MNILYLSTAPSVSYRARIAAARRAGVDEVTYGMPEASIRFHGLLTAGLAQEPGVHVESVVAPPLAPAFHRRGWWPPVFEHPQTDLAVQHLGLINLPWVKQAGLASAIAARVAHWRRRHEHDGVVILDAAYVSALPGVLAALAGSTIPVIGIVADIYPYMADAGDSPGGVGVALIRRLMRCCYARLDGFVLFTAAMNDVINATHAPALVLEGIAPDDPQPPVPSHGDTVRFMYAGALRAEYGVQALVTAFHELVRTDVRLEVYGGGPLSGWIETQAKADDRIRFHGHQPLSTVLTAERDVSFLINPRPTSAAFTRFSFPSKVMEYLASGTPTLCTRLPGIPDEYFEYLQPIEDDTVPGIRAALERAAELSPDERATLGCAGQDFVATHKSQRAQARRLAQFAASLREHR